jgi:foldase protein PrsA
MAKLDPMHLRSATLPPFVRPMLRHLLALCALLSVVVLSACGGSSGVPGNAVARIGDTSVTKTDFNHWMQVAAISSAGQTGTTGAAAKAPVPPDFTACVAQKTKSAPKPAKGQPNPTPAQFKTQCQQEYASLRDQVMSFLISADWIQGEAKDRKVTVTDKEVQTAFDKTKKQSFPKEADYQKFLKSSGMTQADILFRVKLDTVSNKLRAAVTKGKDKVTPAQITAYYNKNQARFAQPERRDLRIVLTKTEAKAKQAKAALDGGQSWTKVAKQYSVDQASKAQGGQLLGVAKGQQEKALDDAVFAAAKGKILGPVKTQFGWYVFEVSKITPKSQQTEQEASPTIKQLLASQGQQKALDTFVKDFRTKWKAKTDCRSGFATQDCKNAPKVKTNTAATATAPAGAQTTP